MVEENLEIDGKSLKTETLIFSLVDLGLITGRNERQEGGNLLDDLERVRREFEVQFEQSFDESVLKER